MSRTSGTSFDRSKLHPVSAPAAQSTDWFDAPDAATAQPGLRFSCTLCGNCCSGPPGYILVSDAEVDALARRANLTRDDFLRTHTHMTSKGRSLNEKPSPHGNDCIFLDREKIPGKAVCSVYEDRPMQCRTWPFWPSVVKSRHAWERAKYKNGGPCPGLGTGTLYTPVQIRIQRESFRI